MLTVFDAFLAISEDLKIFPGEHASWSPLVVSRKRVRFSPHPPPPHPTDSKTRSAGPEQQQILIFWSINKYTAPKESTVQYLSQDGFFHTQKKLWPPYKTW